MEYEIIDRSGDRLILRSMVLGTLSKILKSDVSNVEIADEYIIDEEDTLVGKLKMLEAKEVLDLLLSKKLVLSDKVTDAVDLLNETALDSL